MATGSEAIRVIEGAIALGFTPADALLRAMDATVGDLAGEWGDKTSAVSMCLNFYQGRVFGPVRDKVAARLGLPREYVDGVIERRKVPAVAAVG